MNVIPHAALTQHVIALGKTRSGKSSKVRVLVEFLLGIDAPVSIIDPKGDWWGLKSSADGKRSGFPIVIFGGEHADVPINAHSGAHVAELVATGNRPCLIDVSQMSIGERTRFFIDYAATLFKLSRGTRYQVIDECHNFAPKGKIFDPEAGKCLHWANRLASEGQGKGVIVIAASQRPQKVHNDFLTSCETLIACRVIHKADRDAIRDWIEGCADATVGREVIASLANMQRADAWVWSPEIDFGPKLVTWPMFSTYDSFKPQAADVGKLEGWASVDLEDVKTKLAAVVEEAKASDPKALRARIAELEQKLRSVKAAKAGTPDDELRTAVKAADARGFERGIAEARRRVVGSLAAIASAVQTIKRASTELEAAAISAHTTNEPAPQDPAAADSNARRIRSPNAPRAAPAADPMRSDVGGGSQTTATEKMPRAFLTALAQHRDGLTKSKLLVHTGYRSSGHVSACFAELIRNCWVVPDGSLLVVTDAGLDALGDYEPLPTGDALRAQLLGGNKLSAMERQLLQCICGEHPSAIAKGAVLAQCGYSSSGHTSSAFARLVALGYAIPSGTSMLRAAAELFS